MLFSCCVTTKRRDYSERNRANIQAHLCSCVVGQSEKLRLDADLPAAALILTRWDERWHCRRCWFVLSALSLLSVCAETHLDMNSTTWRKYGFSPCSLYSSSAISSVSTISFFCTTEKPLLRISSRMVSISEQEPHKDSATQAEKRCRNRPEHLCVPAWHQA